MPRTRTERRDFVLTVICLVLFAGSLVSSLIGSIRRLLVEPNRAAWEIGIDWLLVAVFITSAILVVVCYLKAVAYMKAEDAEAAETASVHEWHAENVTLPRLRSRVIGPEDFPTEEQLRDEVTRRAAENPHLTPEQKRRLP